MMNMSERSIIEEPEAHAIISALSTESRYSIYLYLSIYNELTLDELSELMNKSKSTIHHHIQELINVDIVNEYTKPGSKTKYYKLKLLNIRPKLVKTFGIEAFKNISKDEQIQMLNEFAEISNANNYIMQYFLELIIENEKRILKKINDEKQKPSEGRKDLVDHFIGALLISEKHRHEFKREMLELLEKYNKIEEKNPNEKKPYLYLMAGANIEDILSRKYNE